TSSSAPGAGTGCRRCARAAGSPTPRSSRGSEMQRLDLNGAAGIVTGGASGIGEASARQLAALGARIVVADLQEERGQAVAGDIGGLYVKCDVSSEEDGAAVVAAAGEMGPLRVLVNSAGIGRAARTIDRNNDPMPQK